MSPVRAMAFSRIFLSFSNCVQFKIMWNCALGVLIEDYKSAIMTSELFWT